MAEFWPADVRADDEFEQGPPPPREHPHADKRQTFRVGYFVWADVEAFDASEAGIVGEAAFGWPGNWSIPHDPVPYEGSLNGYIVRASIVRSQAMTASLSASSAPVGES